MTSTLRANRRTTVSRRLTLLSAATSWCLAMAGLSMAQEPVRPPSTQPAENKVQPPQKDQPGTLEQQNQQALEDEGRYTPPSRAQLYRVDSEFSLAEMAIQLRKSSGKTALEFPDSENMRITSSMKPRNFQQSVATKQPSYVVYQPLYFQQINHERYGWEFGVFQPIVSTGQFYADVLLFPYKFAANPPWWCDTNAGYALPGDPVPLRFLTTPFCWRGVIAEAGVAVGGVALFP